MASDDELETRFQEAHGAYVFREGKPRAVLEVKRPQISTMIYEARLRGYDRAAAKERAFAGGKEVTGPKIRGLRATSKRDCELRLGKPNR
jgi:hypothetical protein